MKRSAFISVWQEHQQELHSIHVRLTRLENRVKVKALLARLAPQALQHCEVF
jgi:hypothetical protein